MKFFIGQHVLFKTSMSKERCVGKIVLLEKNATDGDLLYYRIISGEYILSVMPNLIERLVTKDERFLYEISKINAFKRQCD